MTIEEWKKKNPPILRKPQTNYDRLISKAPEELAEKMVDNSYCPPETACKTTCKECWLDWLRSPTEVDDET